MTTWGDGGTNNPLIHFLDKRRISGDFINLSNDERETVMVLWTAFTLRQTDALERTTRILMATVRLSASIKVANGMDEAMGVNPRRQEEYKRKRSMVEILQAILKQFKNANLNTVEGPTAEAMVRQRLRPDPILRLEAGKHIESQHVEAAREIARIFEAITAQLCPKGGNIDASSAAAKAKGGSVRVDHMPDYLADWYSHAYVPWARAVQKKPHLDLSLVLMVCVDGVPLSEARSHRSMGQKRALAAIVGGLDLYVSIAGLPRRRHQKARRG